MSSEIGEYFGYPDCCIKSYLGPESALNHVERFEDVPFGETGFVPCRICATERSEEEVLAEIASRRKCPTPFPNDDGAREFIRERMKAAVDDPAGDGHYMPMFQKTAAMW